MKRNDRGITLIALVVTIVVLLILAAVSISMLGGENGIIKQAEDTKIMTRASSVEDEVVLWKGDKYISQKNNTISETENDMIQRLRNNKLITTDDEVDTTNKIVKIKKKDGTVVKEISYKVEVKLITFYISTCYIYPSITMEYQAEEGMTWTEWVESKYNTSGFKIVGRSVMDNSGEGYLTVDATHGGWVDSNSKIEIHNYKTIYVAECVCPNSEILVSLDGKTTLAKDIKEKYEIAYFDFNENVIKIGKVSKVYIHKNATDFVRYTFEDGSYLEATDYHPIYTENGWKSLTQRNGYPKPQIGDKVKTSTGWKKLINIETWQGLENCYDFAVITKDGTTVNNYFANRTLVQGSY